MNDHSDTRPSLQELVDTYGPLVSSVCWRMTRNEDWAREAAQEVWLEVTQAFPSFAGRSQLSTWIFGVAWRATRRFTQTERRLSVPFLKQYFSGPDIEAPQEPDLDRRVWAKSMCDKCLAGTLQCLAPEVRLAYILRDVAELEYEEIAQVLNTEPAAVRQEVSRARRKLGRFLTGQCALQNPEGACRCRMRKHVDAVDLPAEYARVRQSVRTARLYRESEQVLPAKNYWLELLGSERPVTG